VRVLVTRPEPDDERTATVLRALGHDAVTIPLLRFVPLANVDFGAGPWGAVLLTSANGCRALAAQKGFAELLTVPVFAVGARTAEVARAAGFTQVTSAEGDFHALVRLVTERQADKSRPLLYPAGETRSGDLAAALGAAGFTVRTIVVYRAVAELPGDIGARLADGRFEAVLHFSRRSAESFLAAARSAGLRPEALTLQHYCLSAQVAAPLAAAGAGGIHIAAAPHERALLDMLVR
jgi:uroporphyrinogen-III synthase